MSVWPSNAKAKKRTAAEPAEGESRPPTQARLDGRQRLRDPTDSTSK
jgi:hypothetical protein